MGKSENYFVSENYCSLKSHSLLKQLTKCVYEVQMSIKDQGHSLPSVKGNSDFIIKICFSQKLLSYLKSNFI